MWYLENFNNCKIIIINLLVDIYVAFVEQVMEYIDSFDGRRTVLLASEY